MGRKRIYEGTKDIREKGNMKGGMSEMEYRYSLLRSPSRRGEGGHPPRIIPLESPPFRPTPLCNSQRRGVGKTRHPVGAVRVRQVDGELGVARGGWSLRIQQSVIVCAGQRVHQGVSLVRQSCPRRAPGRPNSTGPTDFYDNA